MVNMPVFTVPKGREIERDYIFLPKLNKIDKYVYDMEVTVRNPEDYSAFVPENRACLMGYFNYEHGKHVFTRVDDDTERLEGRSLAKLDSTFLYIGHNIKYDLHWKMRLLKRIDPAKVFTMKDIPLLWDTQLVEYLLTSQEVKMVSLDTLCKIYGLPTKPTYVKDEWAKGVLTKDIDPGELTKYLKHDLDSTKAIFHAQLEEVAKRSYEFQVLVQMQLNMLRMVTLMEWNGLCLDTKKCLDVRDDLEKKAQDLLETITKQTLWLTGNERLPEWEQINYTSNHTVAWVLYGEGWPIVKRIEGAGFYKNGNPKTKKVPVQVHHHGAPHRNFYTEWNKDSLPRTDGGELSVSEDALLAMRSIARRGGSIESYIDNVLEYRRITKLNGTYIAKLPTFLRSPADSIIHHKLNQSITSTGRLSSSQPNMQNRPPEVVSLFKSRFENGVVISIDFSQIEIYALAQECKDPQLLKDLNEGKDIHWETGCAVYPDWVYKKKEEIPHGTYRDIKSVNFGIIYGGGDKAVSTQTGVSKGLVKSTRNALYGRYPGILEWQEANIAKVEKLSRLLPGAVRGGYPAHFAVLPSVTGRTYLFNDEISPEWLYKKTGARTSYSPTQIKNFPIQGLATGDWVPCIVADFFSQQAWAECQWGLPINTTHDDLEIDVNWHLGSCPTNTMGVLFNDYLERKFPAMWKAWTGTDLLVPLSVKVKLLSEVSKDE